MANTNVTMRIDETLKAQLQELMSNLGLDMTTFFTMAAKQAVREQALPFKPDMNETPNIETYRTHLIICQKDYRTAIEECVLKMQLIIWKKRVRNLTK